MITLQLQQLQRNASFLFTSRELILEIISHFAVSLSVPARKRKCHAIRYISQGKGVYGTRSYHSSAANNRSTSLHVRLKCPLKR